MLRNDRRKIFNVSFYFTLYCSYMSKILYTCSEGTAGTAVPNIQVSNLSGWFRQRLLALHGVTTSTEQSTPVQKQSCIGSFNTACDCHQSTGVFRSKAAVGPFNAAWDCHQRDLRFIVCQIPNVWLCIQEPFVCSLFSIYIQLCSF